MDDRSFGDLLRLFRTRAQLTQRELADVSGVSQRDISDLERGVRRFPYRYTVDQLATALNLSEAEQAMLVSAARRTSHDASAQQPAVSILDQQTDDTRGETISQPTSGEHVEAPASSVPSSQAVVTVTTPWKHISLMAHKLVSHRGATLLYRTLPIVLVLALFLGGPWRDNLAPLSGPPTAPESQQVLRVGISSLNTLDPQLVSITDDYEVTQLIFPSLVQLDDHLRVENWAAAHIAISHDGQTYTFTLRHGLLWSNGTPITAGDFAFAINRALNPCTQAPAATYYFPILDAKMFHDEPCANGAPSGTVTTLIGHSLQVLDKQTLVIHLDHPAAYFLDALTYPNAWAAPQALISTYGERWTEHMADAGGLGGDLFKVVAWQPGNKLVLRRNEHFWGAHAKLRELDFTVTADSAKMYANYLDGKGDVSQLLPEQFASARLRSDAREIDILSMLSLFLNWSEPPLNDERMRQAFALALNKKQLAQDIFANLATPTNHIVPQGMPGFYPDLSGPDSTKNLTGNLADASASAQAYANDHCGGNLRKCPPVVVGVLDQIPNAATFAVEMRDMWLQAMPGYPISVTVISQSTYFDLVLHDDIGKFQLLTVFWAADYPDPQDWLSNLLLPDSPFNLGHASVPEANTLMRQADADQNTVRRLSEYNQAEQSLVTNVATIPLFQFTWVYMVRPYVTNFQETALGGVSSNTWQRVYIAQH